MMRRLTPTGLVAGMVLVAGTALLQHEVRADAVHEVIEADAIEWMAAPDSLPPGAEVTVLHGDPYSEGVYAIRVKVPADYTVPPHIHPLTENVTVIDGTLYIGMGEVLDREAGEAMQAGDFISIPPDHPHAAWTEGEPAIFQIHAEGPYRITYIDAEDDPRS